MHNENLRTTIVYPQELQHRLLKFVEERGGATAEAQILDFIKIRLFLDKERLKFKSLNQAAIVRVGDKPIDFDLLLSLIPRHPSHRKTLVVYESLREQIENILDQIGEPYFTHYVTSSIALGLELVKLAEDQQLPNRHLALPVAINDKEYYFF